MRRFLSASGFALAAMAATAQPSVGQDPAGEPAPTPNDEATWAAVSGPSDGAPSAIGAYAGGCLAGAVALPLDGPGFTVIRPQSNDYWGHPNLIDFVRYMGLEALRRGVGTLLIGALGQPRGGPIAGHHSHQIGLDVDIWFRALPDGAALSDAERRNPQPLSLVDAAALNSAAWSDAHVDMLHAAATHPWVNRVFVNPLIKEALCQTVTGDRAWLARIRPWQGHTSHMHIRLNCPEGAGACAQPALVEDEGCGAELAAWLSGSARSVDVGAAGETEVAGEAPAEEERNPLPRACGDVLAD